MRKRVLSFLLAASAAFCFICSSAPVAQAIVPIGLVQSALASYVTSAGYKMWSENGGGELMVEALSTLYQSWLDSTDPVGALTLGQMTENDYVYLDTSGQIVIRKAAADMFQQFADWIQTEYSVPVGSDTPTVIVSSGPPDWTNGQGVNATLISDFSHVGGSYGKWVQPTSILTVYRSSGNIPGYFGSQFYNNPNPSSYFATFFDGVLYTAYASSDSYPLIVYSDNSTSSGFLYQLTGANPPTVFAPQQTTSSPYPFINNGIAVSTVNPSGISVTALSEGLASGLGVTLAQAVADVVGQAKEDDAVVIGVGASAGATAQDIADMVAQGVKAQTLDPSVSITAEAVIDTPVQPYPDIDGLGLPTLGAALVDRFPFCIPWDFVDTVKLLSADPQPININVDLIPQRIKTSVGITSDTSFDIDLSGEQYAKIGVFCRWGSLITFCFGLFLLTKRLVWTA